MSVRLVEVWSFAVFMLSLTTQQVPSRLLGGSRKRVHLRILESTPGGDSIFWIFVGLWVVRPAKHLA